MEAFDFGLVASEYEQSFAQVLQTDEKDTKYSRDLLHGRSHQLTE